MINYLSTVIQKSPSSQLHLGLVYRTLSLFLTSLFYLIGSYGQPFHIKLSSVVAISLLAIASTHLYNKFELKHTFLKLFVLIELIFLLFFVLYTGGIESPFIWYSLNPILVAISFLSPIFSWGLLFSYLASITFLSGTNISFSDVLLIMEESAFIYLACLLGVLLANLFSRLTRELDLKMEELKEANEQLLELNRKHEAAIEQVVSLNNEMNRYSTKMAILEEQNRIANEIHDNVSQKLFGLVYSLHNLQHKYKNVELSHDLHFLGRIANEAMKEIRAAIYRLSSVKKGEQPVLNQFRLFLDEFSTLHGVKVIHQVSGVESALSYKLKESLIRILNEACGNAVRHGKCERIYVSMTVTEDATVLEIHDNGSGMVIKPNREEEGIGLHNIKKIVGSFGGVVAIDSEIGKGTSLQIEIPNRNMQKVVGI
ncbi:sensor histidine kinase [Chungangia koreensis]|uniref:Oxygen sensor histidine kinase NreB n=1 Tax=Chungangia koreensis TaxID=752657 RepID=A0ABV8X788_9LACT